MRKNEKNYGWMKIISWVCLGVIVFVAGRHLLTHGSFDYVTTPEWIIIGVAALGELIWMLPSVLKNKE